ncbi:hypothetical protein IQ268_26110 [Oculatella sp. LEGE 06141]|uniref:hypothetical protein n=1 Tax=Oculatella sp. LEGE 06141 TaxID=1828648 RepID=UPI00187F9F4C|nr:hypothetical protein [Oculatella sp. LEGE 06141]MBE9182047.1 hypothetical protein [Oculatella sp. LEGE 06141]
MLSKASHSHKKVTRQTISEMPVNGGSRRCLGWRKSEPNYSANQQKYIEFKVFDRNKSSYTSEKFDLAFPIVDIDGLSSEPLKSNVCAPNANSVTASKFSHWNLYS